MALPERMLDAVRRSRRTLYIITGAYVLIGFAIALPAAASGDRLSAFLGFIIVSGSLATAWFVGAVSRVVVYLTYIGRSVEEIQGRLATLEVAPVASAGTTRATPAVQVVDLASVGTGDPSELVAATLERGRFPRLLDSIDEAASTPPSGTDESPACENATEEIAGSCPGGSEESGPADAGSPVTVKDLTRQWKLGVRNADLASCREVFAALVDIAAPDTVAAYRAGLNELADRMERGLRLSFREYMVRRDYPGMLEVGERICRELPDRPIAEEFRRIRASLLGRCLSTLGDNDTGESHDDRPVPSLRVVY